MKKDVTEPLLYALVFAALLGYRLATRRRPAPARAEQTLAVD